MASEHGVSAVVFGLGSNLIVSSEPCPVVRRLSVDTALGFEELMILFPRTDCACPNSLMIRAIPDLEQQNAASSTWHGDVNMHKGQILR
jgi:hypothetical protein